ncbi:MAG: CRISPR system precrRNA processing endoribonuclease RAMP protein Cas6 [Bacillota bacterium]
MLEAVRFTCYKIMLAAGPRGLELVPSKITALQSAFIKNFRRVVCNQNRRECARCAVFSECPYYRIFLGSHAGVHQGKAEPFVLELPFGNKTSYQPGETLAVGLILIGDTFKYLPHFISSLQEMGATMEKTIGAFRLVGVVGINPLSNNCRLAALPERGLPCSEELSLSGAEIERAASCLDTGVIAIDYITVTRLRQGNQVAERAEFSVLIRNLLRRIRGLGLHQGEAGLENFLGLARKAQQVYAVSDYTRWVDLRRPSRRATGSHLSGGLMGQVTYRGDLAPFLTLLKLGELLHVGWFSGFGLGKYLILSK